MVAELSPRHCCWFDDQAEVHTFATNVLAELLWRGRERTDVVLEYFEKPWHWDDLHDLWALRNEPTIDDDGWESFVAEAEEMRLI